MGGFDNLNQNIFGLTALIVSLVALLTTVLQVLQQYFSSADGYRRCAASVMGLWAQGTHRKIVLKELRFEVVFETPVIFLAHPKNKRGPVAGKQIYVIDGTPESYHDTRVLQPFEQERADEQATSRVTTADDERASWVNLLSALQREESESRKWDEEQRMKAPPAAALTLPKPPEYLLTVCLQSKTRSWDFMPGAITRPYATTAICHLVETVTMLGMYWKVFDQILWNLRAEGNGIILISTTVHGLGVMVSFATTAKSNFTDNRVIPNELGVKSLAFGTVPNIFDDESYLNRQEDAQSLELLFGTDEEVETTLESLGCQAETLRKYRKDHKHIFSVSFEIIGMLGQVFRLRGSSFRMIPNPTHDQWLKKIGAKAKASWKITRLMEVFQRKLKDLSDAEGFGPLHQVTFIQEHWATISALDCTDESKLSIQCREAIHDALDESTKYLLELKQADVLHVLVAHIAEVVEILDDPNSPLNTIVLANKEDALLSHYFCEIRPAVVGNLDSNEKLLSNKDKDQRNTIWISLIFRMLCWLLIHDFDKADVKIVPSDLKGSRMPVFIG